MIIFLNLTPFMMFCIIQHGYRKSGKAIASSDYYAKRVAINIMLNVREGFVLIIFKGSSNDQFSNASAY